MMPSNNLKIEGKIWAQSHLLRETIYNQKLYKKRKTIKAAVFCYFEF